jgi:hypothetical protein
MDERIEAFLNDVLALEGENSNVVREASHIALPFGLFLNPVAKFLIWRSSQERDGDTAVTAFRDAKRPRSRPRTASSPEIISMLPRKVVSKILTLDRGGIGKKLALSKLNR